MKRFRKFRDPRFALTTLQNPTIELRSHAELVQAAQLEREKHAPSAPLPAPSDATQPPAAPEPPPAVLDPQCAGSLVALAAPTLAPSASLSMPPVVSVAPVVEEKHTPPHSSKPRRKSKSRRRSSGTGNPARAVSATAIENQAFDDDDPQTISLERHARKCTVCRHPERQSIDEAFLHWRSPKTIMHCFGIASETAIYRHAHAFNFFPLRNRNLQSALANVIEDIDSRGFTGAEILNAVRALAHINEDGRWIHPTSKSEVVLSTQRLSAGQATLPASQAALPAFTQPEPILIASRSLLENDANH